VYNHTELKKIKAFYIMEVNKYSLEHQIAGKLETKRNLSNRMEPFTGMKI
jgi:hypothetical protein